MPARTSTSRSATLARRSDAASSDHMHAFTGWNSLIWASIFSTLLPAASATTCSSGFARTISSVWVPMEPVEPSKAKRFIFMTLFLSLGQYCIILSGI